MLSRPAMLILALLLLSSLAQGGIGQKRRQYLAQGRPVLRECERSPMMNECKHHCEADQDCQANNICCLAPCGNICVSLVDNRIWEEFDASPATPPTEEESFSTGSFEGDMASTSSFTPMAIRK
ncbi:WAP four-disulfide core domain protein 10A-like isoform X2 [Mesocricetus auratus]|uniref:WAP four-disulfide core domain protein 10A-like isoform X2 n=1 Tax=Mesocricetus auratus TaxID=10036 RepID=A0ABM2WDH3_MESAU|nr:WAP four-disulfide core domain protein 10A-like isoform X2 [Mesocricetus auratus]